MPAKCVKILAFIPLLLDSGQLSVVSRLNTNIVQHLNQNTDMEISAYKTDDEQDILAAIKEDPNWDVFTNKDAIDSYKTSLRDSITFVCRHNTEFAGYIRAVLDKNIAVYISELFVIPKWRNQKIARTLLSRVKTDYPTLTVYALSDEDAYYEKLNYRKVGSVFQL